MIIKIFEVRDSGTFIPVLAIKAVPERNSFGNYVEAERYLLRRAGYGFEQPSIILIRAECSGLDNNATYDAYAWPANGTRTLHVAHLYIEKNFDSLRSGDVIDVEYELGETKVKKVSERIEHP